MILTFQANDVRPILQLQIKAGGEKNENVITG